MKKALKYSGIVALLLAIVAFILMMVTNAIIQTSGSLQVVTAGTTAIFGKTEHGALVDVVYKPSVLALIGWILALVGMLILCLGVVLPLLKVKALDKFAGLLNLIAVACLVVAGVFCFLVVPTYFAANDADVPSNAAIGAGWVIAGIVYILAGCCAIAPAAADFLGKKK
jgi:hypothetical protein